MRSGLSNGSIEKRIRQLGQGNGVKVVIAQIIFVDGEAYLQSFDCNRYEMNRGADMTSIVNVIATNLVPTKSNGTGRKRKKKEQVIS